MTPAGALSTIAEMLSPSWMTIAPAGREMAVGPYVVIISSRSCYVLWGGNRNEVFRCAAALSNAGYNASSQTKFIG